MSSPPPEPSCPWPRLRAELPFTPEGGVDWGQRPFAKRWSIRRLGRAGLLELAAEHVPLRRRCWRVDEGAEEEGAETTLGAGLDAALREERERHVWLLEPDARWLLELSPEGTFSFEFIDARHTRMLKRLQAVERRWQQGG